MNTNLIFHLADKFLEDVYLDKYKSWRPGSAFKWKKPAK